MITTKVTLTTKTASFAQFVATQLGVNLPEVYGAMIQMGITGDNPQDLVVPVKAILGGTKAKPASTASKS